jgi:hypothetical protein
MKSTNLEASHYIVSLISLTGHDGSSSINVEITLLPRIREEPGSNIVVFLSSSKKIAGYNFKIGHKRFLSLPFQFIMHLSSYR